MKTHFLGSVNSDLHHKRALREPQQKLVTSMNHQMSLSANIMLHLLYWHNWRSVESLKAIVQLLWHLIGLMFEFPWNFKNNTDNEIYKIF